MRRLRVFIAVTPPETVRRQIGHAIDKLKHENFPILWENPENLHMTLIFLGHITQSRMEAAARAVERTIQSYAPFEARVGELSYFFKKGKDAIIFLDIEDPQKQFRNLYKKLFRSLSDEDFYPPARFTPHILIGRLKRQRHAHEKKRLLSKIAETEIPQVGSFTVNQLNIYESIYSKTSSAYDPGSNLPAGKAGTQRYHLLKSFPLI